MDGPDVIDKVQLQQRLEEWLAGLGYRPRTVLLMPPDMTRSHSYAGPITSMLYKMLSPSGRVDVMPALGTHQPMTETELRGMFGDTIPLNRFVEHRWRQDLCLLGSLPPVFIGELSEGRLNCSVEVEVNRRIIKGGYDLVVSIGQVVPHEVAGMANHAKNIFVGCGGKDIIDKSHYLGAVYGMERIMGRADTPVRRLFDAAEHRFLQDVPLQYILTVTSLEAGENRLNGLFIGKGREVFEQAAALSQHVNLTRVDRPLQKVVAYLDPAHYRSTWLGNKAIYRSRMAIADGGELIIIAPGVKRFGEDREVDQLIRKYGYMGTPTVLKHVAENTDLRENLCAAAHLIHGSSEGRFRITYVPGQLCRDEVESVGYGYAPLESMLNRYSPSLLQDGIHHLHGGETIYFISNPALGLWIYEA